MAYPQSNRRRAAQRVAALFLASGVIGAGTAAADPRRPVLDPTQDCTLHTVVSGDTLSRIAQRNGLTLEDVIARNRHLTNPDLIWPGDQAVIRCAPKADTRPAPSSTVTEPPTTTFPQPEAAMQRIVRPNLEQIIADGTTPTTFSDSCGNRNSAGTALTPDALVALLYKMGARGNQLIGLAAVAPGESGMVVEKVGDCRLEDRQWGPSVGLFQVRTVKPEKGKDTPRDIEHISDAEGNAWAAIQVYNSALSQGRDPLNPWTAHLRGDDRPHVATMTEAAQRLGLLDGER